MTTTRFVPFRNVSDVAVLQNRLNSIFHDFARPAEAQETLATGNFVPAVDVYEDETRLILRLEVPGIPQQDLDLRVENQTLTVKGERKFPANDKDENYHRIERRFGTFIRSFTLPVTVDTAAIAATYQHGVLAIELKKEAAKPRSIKIEVTNGAPAPQQVEGATS